MATPGNFTITRKTRYPRAGRRTLHRKFKTAEGAVAWLNATSRRRRYRATPTRMSFPALPLWLLRANGREVLRVDRYGLDCGLWARPGHPPSSTSFPPVRSNPMRHRITGRATKCGPSAVSAIAGIPTH